MNADKDSSHPSKKINPPRHYLKRSRPSESTEPNKSNQNNVETTKIVGDMLKHSPNSDCNENKKNKEENIEKRKHPIYHEIDNMLSVIKGFEYTKMNLSKDMFDKKSDDNKLSYIFSSAKRSYPSEKSEGSESAQPVSVNQKADREKSNPDKKHENVNSPKVHETIKEDVDVPNAKKEQPVPAARKRNPYGARKISPVPFLIESQQPGVYVPLDAILNNRRPLANPRPIEYLKRIQKIPSADQMVPQHHTSKCQLGGQCSQCTLEINQNANHILENLKGMLETDMKSYKNMKYKLLEENCTQTENCIQCGSGGHQNAISKNLPAELDISVEKPSMYKIMPKCFMVELNPMHAKKLENFKVQRKTFVADDRNLAEMTEISSSTNKDHGEDVVKTITSFNYLDQALGKFEQDIKTKEHTDLKMKELEKGMTKLEEKLVAVTKMDKVKDFAIDQLRVAWKRLIDQWDEIEAHRLQMSEEYKADKTKFEKEKSELEEQVQKNKEQLTESYNLVERAHLRIMELEKSEQAILEELENLKDKHNQQKDAWQKKINDTTMENRLLANTITKMTEIRSN